MDDIQAKIIELEEELTKTKYNKRTQHHIGLVKAKIAKLKESQVSRSRGKGKTTGYSVKKTGDATAVLVGFPSVGKSTLINQLTSAESKTAEYAFTTLEVIPGMLVHKHASIQLLDVPGLVSGAADGTGRGKEVIAVVRTADLAIFVIDVRVPHKLLALATELQAAGLRLDDSPPKVRVINKERGGISIIDIVPQELDQGTILAILRENKVNNAEVRLGEELSIDRLIDGILGNRVYLPSLVALNKIDLADKKVQDAAVKYIRSVLPRTRIVPVSASVGSNLPAIRDAIYEQLNFYRIYLKEIGKKPDMDEPLIIRHQPSIEETCRKIHKDFLAKFRFARVWGRSAKFPGQKFLLKHLLADGDILEVHLR